LRIPQKGENLPTKEIRWRFYAFGTCDKLASIQSLSFKITSPNLSKRQIENYPNNAKPKGAPRIGFPD